MKKIKVLIFIIIIVVSIIVFPLEKEKLDDYKSKIENNSIITKII